MHNGLVTMAGEKMSKSLGNTLQVREIVKQWRPVEVRYYLGAAHYRSTIEFSPDGAGRGRRGLPAHRELRRAGARGASARSSRRAPCRDAFAAAMDDDLGVPARSPCCTTRVRDGNTALADGAKETRARGARAGARR